MGGIKHPVERAQAVADVLMAALAPACERIVVAGSIRRQKKMVGDVELFYLPKVIQANADLFGNTEAVSAEEPILDDMIKRGVLGFRLNKLGNSTWGGVNRLAVHVPSGMPVDLFRASEENWFNYLVCRTGGAVNNMRIATEAIKRGMQWNPTGRGFSVNATGEIIPVNNERDVYEIVGMKYPEPWERF